MSSFLLLACLAVSDVDIEPEQISEVVDIIELHHCYDFRGRVAFRQLIFYRWSSYHRRFQVIDTVVVTSDNMCPKRTKSGLFRCQWKDQSQIRSVSGLTLRKSRSTADPEIAERDFLPTELRTGLKRWKIGEPEGQTGIRTSKVPLRPEKLLKF